MNVIDNIIEIEQQGRQAIKQVSEGLTMRREITNYVMQCLLQRTEVTQSRNILHVLYERTNVPWTILQAQCV
jgi:hypothetical protein